MTNRDWLDEHSNLTGREIVELARAWYEKTHGKLVPGNIDFIVEWLRAEKEMNQDDKR